MDPEILEALKIALASALIGFGIATTLYGITCLQIYLYYRNYPKDSFSVKLVVAVLWVLDTLAVAGVAHTLYVYLIFRLGESDFDFLIPWSYAVQSETIDLITIITQCFFAWQIWKVGRNVSLVSVIVILSVAAWALDIEVVVNLFKNPSAFTLANPTVLISGTTVQGLDAVCDIIITTSFIYYFNSFRSGVKPTEKIIDNLILYAVSRGILTVVTQIVFVSLDAAFPGKLFWLPFQQAVGKLYVNSVLASLNSRKVGHAQAPIILTETVSRGPTPPWSPDAAVSGQFNRTRSTGTTRAMSFAPNEQQAFKSTNTDPSLQSYLSEISSSMSNNNSLPKNTALTAANAV